MSSPGNKVLYTSVHVCRMNPCGGYRVVWTNPYGDCEWLELELVVESEPLWGLSSCLNSSWSSFGKPRIKLSKEFPVLVVSRRTQKGSTVHREGRKTREHRRSEEDTMV